MYFYCPKKSGEISAEKNFIWKNFIAPKDSSLNLRGVCWAAYFSTATFFSTATMKFYCHSTATSTATGSRAQKTILLPVAVEAENRSTASGSRIQKQFYCHFYCQWQQNPKADILFDSSTTKIRVQLYESFSVKYKYRRRGSMKLLLHSLK